MRLPAFNFVSPIRFTDASFRHGLAISAAIITHFALVVLVITIPSKLPPPPQRAIAIDLTFGLPLDVQVEDIAPIPIADPDPVNLTPPVEPLPTTESGDPTQRITIDAAPASARSTDRPASTVTPTSEEAYSLRPGTRSVLRGLQCPGDPEAFARTGICPQDARRSAQLVATEETAADFYTIDLDAIRALYGRAPHSLSGQATLGDGTQRRSLSNSDSIREALPASQPDPAFGD
ncbi:MAG: hypothetical protein DHS20C06_16980 [Hyphobacterium sp.]|nr:MAG: hypothetical protein DHS20C06_16980 [Hyphobacterium sp.]